MEDPSVNAQKAENLWAAFARKLPPIERACHLKGAPTLGVEDIGGLAAAKEEILTYACAATHPEVYAQWGTVEPTGLLLIGPPGAGKTLLAEALATRAGTAFLAVNVSRLILQLLHAPAALGELLGGWGQVLAEMPPTTVYFSGFDPNLSQALERPQLPAPPLLELMLELVDRTVGLEEKLVVGSTSWPDALPTSFVEPGRFERVVEVVPIVPDDVIAALEIHAARAEKRAGRSLFETVDWKIVVGSDEDVSIGDWIRNLHAALRRKARCQAAGELPDLVTTEDLRSEVDRLRKARTNLPTAPRRYL
jgi:ATP-dependent 26S proteasome regulatory subunit